MKLEVIPSPAVDNDVRPEKTVSAREHGRRATSIGSATRPTGSRPPPREFLGASLFSSWLTMSGAIELTVMLYFPYFFAKAFVWQMLRPA
jgi:hypothetical protein